MSRGDLAEAIENGLGVENIEQAWIQDVESDLPMISMNTVEDIEMANDLASIAAILDDSEREAAATYWEAAVSLSEQSFERPPTCSYRRGASSSGTSTSASSRRRDGIAP